MYGEGPWGGHRRGRHDGDDRGRNGDPREGRSAREALRQLFEELDTTPGQEKAIVAAFKALEEAVNSAREGWKKTSGDVAQVFRKDSFDEVMLGEAVARLDGAQDSLRKEVVKVVGDIHSALDEKQRGKLADLMERGHADFLWHVAGLRRGES
jgi:Spy/CpxP family protein refolding chaperone